MADFPATLTPSTRTFIPGTYASSALPSLDGNETNVRHSNASVGHTLRLKFINITRANFDLLTNHYVLHATYETFGIGSNLIEGSGLTFPSGYSWRYKNRPVVTETLAEIEVDVELELLPPYSI